MVEAAENLILEHLRAIRSDVSSLREEVQDLKHSNLGIRDDIHGLRGDTLRIERAVVEVQAK